MKSKKILHNESVIIYQAKNGAIELRGNVTHETIWATQTQIANIFTIDRTVATKHIGNVLKNKEVDEKSNVQKMHIANSDKPVTFYSLDIILAVGYRANSAQAIEFRRWATKTLRNYIIDGYAVNKKRIALNYAQFINVVDDIKKLLPVEPALNSEDVISLVSLFADTWLSLDAYDKDVLPQGKLTRKKVELTAGRISENLAELKANLVQESKATDIFGMERCEGALAVIIGNIMQSFSGQDLYKSAEEKAAHLLYFIVKDHPFIDGNKRSGAFAFVWFLKQADILDVSKLTPSALTALTILVASSNPKNKDKIIGLILNLIAKN